VDQGRAYYVSFTNEFPTVEKLAAAEEASVLKLWQGLGYYSRARNLLKTAQQVVLDFNGEFPANYEQLLSLKGIGPYTAAAIASFAFDLPCAVVDGNVYRVLSRYFGVDVAIDSTEGKKTFQALADSLIPAHEPALYNQAIMEYGAMVCTPTNPKCDTCVLFETCASGKSKAYISRPFKSKKTRVKKRYFHYFHVEKGDSIALMKREKKDIWQGLYEFPMIETIDFELSTDQCIEAGIFEPILQFEAKHILSHQHIYARFYTVPSPICEPKTDYVLKTNFHEFPIHRLMEKYWESLG
jgi:A/G-specific adenine glycosylase